MSRIDPVRIYNNYKAPSLVCQASLVCLAVWSLLVANIVHLRVVCIVWCMKRGMVSSESILC